MAYAIYKSALDGSGDKWGECFVPSLVAFKYLPAGRQVDHAGRPFVYSYCEARYWHRKPTRADDLRDLATLGPMSASCGSAASAILGKLATR